MDLPLNNLQRLICHKTQPTLMKRLVLCYFKKIKLITKIKKILTAGCLQIKYSINNVKYKKKVALRYNFFI